MPGPTTYSDAYRNALMLRVVREFTSQPISDPHLHAILEAGRWTGSSKNRQSWSVVAITDPEHKDRLAACGDFTDPVRRAPLAIALVQEQGGNEFDVGRLAQNMMLAAKAVGVASCPVTFHRNEDAARILGIPAEARSRYGIAFGYRAEGASTAHRGGRKELDLFVHWNRY